MLVQSYLHSTPPELNRATKEYRELRELLMYIAAILDTTQAEQQLVKGYRDQIIEHIKNVNVDPSKR